MKMKIKNMRKKSQVIYQSFVVALLIFTVAIFMYYKYGPELTKDGGGEIDELLVNARLISTSLISAGYPVDWNKTTVERIGLTDGRSRINETKLLDFAGMPYKDTKFLFGVLYDYYVFFEAKNKSILLINTSMQGIGKEGVNSTNVFDVEKPKKLVNAKRVVIYNSDIYKMVVYVWEK